MSKNFNDLIPPYCVGCLDPESVIAVNDFIRSGGDLDFQELGEFQNLIALLPSVLPIEQPGQEVKDKVARKLYSMRNEIKKIRKAPGSKTSDTNQSIQPAPDIEPVQPIEPAQPTETDLTIQSKQTVEPVQPIQPEQTIQPEQNIEAPQGNEEVKVSEPLKLNEFILSKELKHTEPIDVERKIHVLNPRRTAEYQRPPHETQVRGRNSGNLYTPYNPDTDKDDSQLQEQMNVDSNLVHREEDIVNNLIVTETASERKSYYSTHEEPETPKRNYKLIIAGLLILFLIAAGLIYTYLKVTQDAQQYKSEVDRLNKKINSLTMQLSSNSEVQSMLRSPNVKIINLQGTEINKNGFGKLIVSADNTSGYIQLAYMPVLPDNMVYQLWLNLSGSEISLGTFKPVEEMGYYSFKIPEIPKGYKTNFLVTAEPETGSRKPGYKVYLTGSL